MQRLEAALRESELRAGECGARNHFFQAQLQDANAEIQALRTQPHDQRMRLEFTVADAVHPVSAAS